MQSLIHEAKTGVLPHRVQIRKEFKEESMWEQTFEIMNSFRKNRVFCDITIVSNDIEFIAHKVILMSRSKYFHDVLNKDISRVDFEEKIDSKSLELLIDYIYSFKITLTDRNVMDLISGSTLLRLNHLKMECSKFLAEQLNPDNCLPISTFAQKYECEELLTTTQNYVNEFYAQLDPQFINFSSQELSEFFSKTNIPNRDEERIYETLIKWVNHDLEKRRNDLKPLIKHVQINLLPRDYLINIFNDPLFLDDIDVKNSIIKTLLHIDSATSANRPLTLLVMGGYTFEAESSFETYNFNENTWSKVFPMPTKRQGTGAVYINGKVYIIGRTDVTRPKNFITEYDYVKNKWLDTVGAKTNRSYQSVVALEDCIYMIGGKDFQGSMNSVEKFDTTTGKVSPSAAMAFRRCRPGLCVYDNCIYAVGGLAKKGCPLRSVEHYDPRQGAWTSSPSLNTPRSGVAVAVLNNMIYAVGGDDGENYLNTCEVFSKRGNKWTPIIPMKIPRKFASAVIANNMLYVIGGFDGKKDLTTIEIYNPKRNLWTLMDKQMQIRRSCHGCVIVPKKLE